ncbi:TetR family transcriptional regulator [Shinella sp. 838]|jgi:AcrR family transcriptional regulator|uniref:TetR/AcrR family transcriptional regulator n=1 Tax=unclassified Shinella TaxID=2643062 RepID=UPI0003C54EE4|nr:MULTISPECIES: TetR family transcriptional regulator [unclassified Shinella]EYR80362.1 putative transcriptional regulator protein, TetR family [Shinella sp. DD12]MCA0341913.1 TetR family transcriptional regulator [Pseudomonadota bacterium]MDG4671792.1 TetR family transcriptional regulator [Shinella sp. 838]
MARSNKERTEATRLALIEAARRLFVEKGYAETATPDIVAEAGVTRGALYHHFEDKKALLRATLEREAEAVAAHIERVSLPSGSPRNALLSGATAYFDAMAEPGRTRLLLLEAPAVLGFESTGAIDRDNAESTLRVGLSDLLGKDVDAARLQALTDLISAAFDRAAIAIETGADRRTYEAAIASLLDGLRA